MTEQRPPKRATLRWPGTRRERRLAILLPLGAAVLVAGSLALLGAFGDEDGGGEDATATGVEAEIEAARGSLTESLRDKRRGIAVSWPRTWRSSNVEGEHVLESRDRCIAIRLSAPVPKDEAGRLRRSTLGTLRRRFDATEVVPASSGKRIGGIPVSEDLITVPTERGGTVRILLSVGRGSELAYLTEVVRRAPGCSRTLLDAQLILNSVRFTR